MPQRARRRDARDNVEKLRVAAVARFCAQGLDAPLDAIARDAGVSVGTLYNHFTSREGLIDAVLAEDTARRLDALAAAAGAEATARRRLEVFVGGVLDLLEHDPALSDALLQRFPAAQELQRVCEQNLARARTLVQDAHDEGSLAADFTAEDLHALLWLAGTAGRAEPPRPPWRGVVDRALRSVWV